MRIEKGPEKPYRGQLKEQLKLEPIASRGARQFQHPILGSFCQIRPSSALVDGAKMRGVRSGLIF